MNVRIRLIGDLSKYFGKERVEIILHEKSTLRDLWDSISSSYGEQITSEFWDSFTRRFSSSVIVVCQGAEITGDDYILSDGEEIILLPPMVGGGCAT